MQILIVDDNKFELHGMTTILKKNFPKAMVYTANNGPLGLKLAKEKFFDLIITDIKMPDINGVELIRAVRQNNSQVKILVVSGYESFEVAKSLLSFDITDYLLKPIDISEFLSIVEKLLLPLETKEKNYSDYTLKTLTLIQNHYTEPISLAYLSQNVHLAPAYLSRVFTKEVGIGVNQYITNLRIEKAKKLLLSTTLKINQIAKEVGFENSSYFNRVFQTQIGQSPTDFRQKEFHI